MKMQRDCQFRYFLKKLLGGHAYLEPPFHVAGNIEDLE